MDEVLSKILDKKLKTARKMLDYDPYTVIASDNEEIRDYFIKKLSKDIIALKDYDLYYPKRMIIHEQLKKGHILLLNFEQKVKQYIEHEKEDYGKENEWMASYNALVGFRDRFCGNGCHTMVIVCDNKTAYGILRDANLGSAVWTSFIDLELKRELPKYYPLQDNSTIF